MKCLINISKEFKGYQMRKYVPHIIESNVKESSEQYGSGKLSYGNHASIEL